MEVQLLLEVFKPLGLTRRFTLLVAWEEQEVLWEAWEVLWEE